MNRSLSIKGFIVICFGLLTGCTALQPAESPPAATAEEEKKDFTAFSPETANFISSEQELFYKTLVAEIAGFRKDYTLSADYFYEAAKQSREPALAERAVEIALYAKEETKALAASRLWVELAPDDLVARQALIALLLRQQQTDEALQQLEILLDSAGELTDQHLVILLKLLRPDEDKASAIKVMAKIVEKRPADAEIQLIYAHLLSSAEKYEEAAAVLKNVLTLAPEHPTAVPLYVEILHHQEKDLEAAQWLAEQLRKHPKQNEWRKIYARLLIGTDQYPQAIREFKSLLAQTPDDSNVLYALGLLYLQSKQLKTAKPYFLKLLKHEKERDSAHYFLGQIAELEKQPPQAINWYRKVGKGQHYLNSQTRIAMILARQGEIKQGLAHLQTIQPTTEDEEITLLLLEAEFLTKQKQYAESMAVYDRGLQDNPDNIELLYYRALLGEKMERLDILERDLRRVIELDPKNVEAINALGYTLADKTDRYQEAYLLIQQALEIKPESFYVLDSMGWVLYRLGRKEEALKYLRQAHATQKDPEVAAHLGEVLWVMGDRKAARQIWQEAQKLFPDDERLLKVLQQFEGGQ